MHRVSGGDPLLFEARENVLGAYQQLRDTHPAFPEVLRDFQVIKSTTNSTACTLLPLQADIVAAAINAEDGHHQSLVRVCGESQCNISDQNFRYFCTLLLMQTPPVPDNSHSSHTWCSKREREGVFQAPTEEQYLSTDSPRRRLFN